MIELYHHGSSACAAKVRFALEEKGLPWNSHVVDIFRGEQFAPQFLALNPKGVVPVLVHDGFVIPESTVICEYLDDAFEGEALLPDSARLRAEVRFWTKAVDEELHPACSALTYVISHRHTLLRNGVGSFEDFLASGSGEGLAARRLKWEYIQEGIKSKTAADKIRLYDSYLQKMELALTNSAWLVGDRFSMADVAMAPYVNRVHALSLDPLWANGRLPHVERWFRRISDRSTFERAFRDWMPADLAAEMAANGRKSWPDVASLLGVASFTASPVS